MAITLNANKFIGTISNLIIYTKYYDKYKIGGGIQELLDAFRSDDVVRGDGVIVRTAGLPVVKDLNVDASSLLSVNKPTITEQYIPVSGYKVIPLTINEQIMGMSFSDEFALANFTGYLIGLMGVSKQLFMYETLSKVIGEYKDSSATNSYFKTYAISGFAKQTQNPTASEDNAIRLANAKAVYRTLLENITSAQIGSLKGTDESIVYDTPNNLVCLIPPKMMSALDVDALATLLKSDILTANVAIKFIPWDFATWKVDDTDNDYTLIVLDRESIQYGYNYQLATSFFDASNLNTNRFLHFSYYCGAVKGAFGFAIEASDMYSE